MPTKLTRKNAAEAHPQKWDETFKAKLAEAGDHLFFVLQIWQKWWKLGFDKVFAAGARLDISLDERGFTWTVEPLNDAARKLLDADPALVKVQTHKGKCSGLPPKPVQAPKAEEKPEPKPEPKPAAKPALTAEDIKSRVRGTPSLGARDDIDKYVARLKRVLEADFSGVTDDHLKAVKLLAAKLYFESAKDTAPAKPASTAKATPTLTTEQADAVDAAMREAQRVANGEMLDNDAQVALGDALTAVFGGKYPTHSRGGGHKGSFNQDKTIQQQLSNIAKILQKQHCDALNEHFGKQWPKYSV